MRLKAITPSSNPLKKYDAIFLVDGREKRVPFGSSAHEDYTLHKDKKRRELYRVRHKKDHIDDPMTPGALSWWVLWGESTSLAQNIKAFKKRFHL